MSQEVIFEDYQQEMIRWQCDRPVSGLFAGMGLGKTLTTLEWIDHLLSLGLSPGVLVVAPLRVGLITWPAQIARWKKYSWMKVADMRTPEGWDLWERKAADVYIINFEMLATREVTIKCPTCKGVSPMKDICSDCLHPKKLVPTGEGIRKDHGFIHRFLKPKKYRKDPRVNALVIDELSAFKAPTGVRAEALRAWLHLFPYRTALTGTPTENSYLDLFNEIRMLDGGERLGVSYTDFREEFFREDGNSGYKWKLKRGSKDKIHAKIADLCLVVRSEDHLGIPETRIEDVLCPLPKKAVEKYQELETELLVQLETGEIEALSAAALATKLLQWTSGCVYDAEKEVHTVHDVKVKALRKIRKQHPDEPILVLTAYKHEMARYLEEFPEARKFHEKDMAEWQAGKIPMWVSHVASLSHGVDGIQDSCRILVWSTLPYGGGRYLQASARVARKGQKKETLIYRLIAPDTIDEAIVALLSFKNNEERGLMETLKALQKLAKARQS